MTSLQNLTVAQLRQVISIKEKIEALEAELAAVTGGEVAAPAGPRARRGMSAVGRARIAAAQRARWAKVKAGKDEPAPKKKRKMSAAGRARIAAAAKARWAKARAAGKNKL